MTQPSAYLKSDAILATTVEAVVNVRPAPAETGEDGVHVVPFELRQWLARLRLLEGVPFAYLAADSALLPPESIRFFYLDRSWADRLVDLVDALPAGRAEGELGFPEGWRDLALWSRNARRLEA